MSGLSSFRFVRTVGTVLTAEAIASAAELRDARPERGRLPIAARHGSQRGCRPRVGHHAGRPPGMAQGPGKAARRGSRDSLLRPVFGHAKEGASFGHTKIAGKQVMRRGLSPLATTISTPTAAPLVAGIRLRAGKAGSGRGADSMVTEAINTARAAGAAGKILVRGDSAYGNSPVVAACVKAGRSSRWCWSRTRR